MKLNHSLYLMLFLLSCSCFSWAQQLNGTKVFTRADLIAGVNQENIEIDTDNFLIGK